MSESGKLLRELMESGAFDRLAAELITPVMKPLPSAPFRLTHKSAPGEDGAKTVTFRDYETTLADMDIEPSPVLDKMVAEIMERYWRDVERAMSAPPQPVAIPVCPNCARSMWGLKCMTCLSRET